MKVLDILMKGHLLFCTTRELIARTLLMPKKTSELIQSDQGNAVTNSGVTQIYNIAKDYVLLMHKKSPLRFVASFTKSVAKVIHDEKVNILFSAEYNSGT
jgi:hypothetical protein